MGFVRDLLVFLHILGVGLLIGTLLLQFKQESLNKGWLHGSALQLLTGLALMLLAPLTHAHYNHVKLGIKLLVVLVIGALAFVYLRKEKVPSWLTPVLGGLTVLNVGLAVFWHGS